MYLVNYNEWPFHLIFRIITYYGTAYIYLKPGFADLLGDWGQILN